MFNFNPNNLPVCFLYLNFQGRIIFVNDQFIRTFGYKKEDLLEKELIGFVEEKDKKKFLNFLNKLNNCKNNKTVELKMTASNEQLLYVSLSVSDSIEKINGEECITCVLTDITNIGELTSKYKLLSRHIESVREDERAFIAREIHDELGQTLTAIKMDISFFIRKANDYKFGEKEIGKLDQLIELTNETIKHVKKITTKLRPGVLDHLGLESAIQWQTNDFQERTGILCNLELSEIPANLKQVVKTNLFRIFQESLTNIMRHSEATKVDVKLLNADNILRLEIADNGVGLAESLSNSQNKFGILGMKERAELLGGKCIVFNHKQGGTKVLVEIPMSN